MRPVCFILCFTIGVCLMVFSGYLPQSASAQGNRRALVTAPDSPRPAGESFTRSLTRRAVTDRGDPDDVDDAESSAWDDQPTVEQPAAVGRPAVEPLVTIADEHGAGRLPSVPETPTDSGAEPSAPSEPVAVADETTSAAPAADAAPVETWPLLADAGPDRVLWVGWDEMALDGRASTGVGLTYQWKQTAGPVSLTIADPRAPLTIATGLLNVERLDWRGATYEFELTVTDAAGEQDTDAARYVVKSAPTITIKPTAARHFEFRDGYQLAHFVAWATNLDSYESLFEVTSDTELAFTKVAGSAYSLTGGKAGLKYTYQIVVYGDPNASTSWVELLVDTDEKVPGIVQLGVNWTGGATPPAPIER